MQRMMTARYGTREEADAARAALVAIGLSPVSIEVREPVRDPGVFDHLARLVSPHRAGDTEGENYHLSAHVPAERAGQAALLLGSAATSGAASAPDLSEQIFEFPETRQELRVEKRPLVREEVILRKTAVEKVADIHGTVRRTEVEIEEILPAEVDVPVSGAEEPLRFGLRTRPD